LFSIRINAAMRKQRTKLGNGKVWWPDLVMIIKPCRIIWGSPSWDLPVVSLWYATKSSKIIYYSCFFSRGYYKRL